MPTTVAPNSAHPGAGQLLDIGPRGYKQVDAAASATFTPLYDRSAYVTAIYIDKPSAADQWQVIVGGRELVRFEIDTVGNQQVNFLPTSGVPKNRDLFTWYKRVTGKALTYPVPNGQTMTVQSVGGATANILIEFEEVTNNTIKSTDVNHYEGKLFTLPIWTYRTTAYTAAAEQPFTTQISPPWVPNLFTGAAWPAGFVANIWALFMEAAGVNTYSGSADVQSNTDYLYATLNGQRLFTRDALAGIPLVGSASATGSANTVYNADMARFPAFQLISVPEQGLISPAIHLAQGVNNTWGLKVVGTFTGSPSYAHAYLMAMIDLVVS